MDDKELVEVWQKQFESKYNVLGLLAKYSECKKQYVFINESEYKDQTKMYQIVALNAAYDAWIEVKRSQPIVVLPEIQICRDSKDEAVRHLDFEDMVYNLTAAGIKYTIGE